MGMPIKPVVRTVYFSPTRGRHYMTKGGAIRAEAKALLQKKFPSEKAEYEDFGFMTYPGFYWKDMPRSDVLFRRVCRLIKNSTPPAPGTNRVNE